ncbi:MAG: DNA-binding protein, partial [Peptococcaceae bacterium]|nr:DNA-binding protein [Peptococcaceae bacterium]
MEKLARINLLYDFYGQLLTDRQKSFIELYYGQDLSLGEIAREFAVTSQAVHDTLRRA